MANEIPEAPEQQGTLVLQQLRDVSLSIEGRPEGTVSTPTTGKRPSLRDVTRQLTTDELTQSGVIKLVVEGFERAENECDSLRIYIEKFHEADKRARILEENLKTDKAFEIITGIGLAGGGAIFSLAPSFWTVSTFQGVSALVIGAIFMAGAIAAKVIKRGR